MAHDEVAAMHELTLDLLGAPACEPQVLRHVVAVVALRLRVAGLAEPLLLRGELAVPPQKALIVPQERLGQRLLEVGLRVAWRAHSFFPFLFVLVTGKALAHRRQRRASGFYDSGVTLDALTSYTLEREMLIVIETDLSRNSFGFGLEYRKNLVRVVAMASGTDFALRQLVRPILFRNGMTAVAAQASGFADGAALEPCQVHLVWEARLRTIRTCRSGGCQEQAGDQP